jgi:hypothetical protein
MAELASVLVEAGSDPYLSARSEPVVDAPSYTVVGDLPRRTTRRILTHQISSTGKVNRPLSARVQAEIEFVMRRPDWSEGLFCSLTRYQGTSRERLLEEHDHWVSWIETVIRRPVSIYRVVDFTMTWNPHVHDLLYGVPSSALSPDQMEDAWVSINRISRRVRSYSADVQRIEGIGAVTYCAYRAVRYGERDILGPWPVVSPSPTPATLETPQQVVDRELKALSLCTGRRGRPRREILYAQSFLLWRLKQGPRDIGELCRLAQGEEFSIETLLGAKRRLGVIYRREGKRRLWALPEAAKSMGS